MKLRNKFYLLVCALLCVSLSQTLFAQTPVSFKFYGTDGGGIVDSLLLVVHPNGTNGATPDSINSTTKESSQGLPPPPLGVDVRVIPNTGWDGAPNYTSIHDLVFDNQSDLWKVQFKRDAAQTSMTFTWQAGLAGVGGGYWKIIGDVDDNDAGVQVLNVDMTTQTLLNVPLADDEAHTFYIKKGDGAKMRTFTPDEIADALDSKLKKGKAEKRKGYASEGCFTFTYTGPDTVGPTTALLYVEFSQAAVGDVPLSSGGMTASSSGAAGKKTKWNFDLATGADHLDNGDLVQICYRGNKGKALVVKKWSMLGVKQATPPGVDPGPVPPRQLLKMPNVNNMGEEIFAQGVFAANTINSKPAGLVIGFYAADGKSGKAVYHPKWKDVTKTLSDKTGKHTGLPGCLSKFGSGKDILKPSKSLPPGKHNNMLLAAAVALRFNIAIGSSGKTPTDGFGDLTYLPQPGDPSGLSSGSWMIKQIADKVDSVMACAGYAVLNGDSAQWLSLLQRLNGSFSGTFDTLSFGGDPGGKPTGGTQATGIAAIADVSYLVRTSSASPRIGNPLDLTILEAVPEKYELAQNYPNPFNPQTTIEFSLPEESFVTLIVYNMLGQEVGTLVDNQQLDEGTNEVTFDASQMASGVYYYRIIVNGGTYQEVKKMMLLK